MDFASLESKYSQKVAARYGLRQLTSRNLVIL
jgi:hypothetical protein